MIEGQAPRQSQSQVWGFMNSQMKVKELSFFENYELSSICKNFNVWIYEKASDSVGKIFHLADFFHLAICCQVEKSCELEKLVSFVKFSIDANKKITLFR